MIIDQKILKPSNWQDFETLCKKLRWEVWSCPEIKKNWRQWQKQNWVDIYWIPSWENWYYGIQCKQKDSNIGSQITIDEINKEIEEAKNFNPPLKKFIIATTDDKSVKTEEYIRNKNIENINQWLFEIHLFSWENIVDLLKDNKKTYDFYVNSINFKNTHNINLIFEDWNILLDKYILFLKTKKIYKHRDKFDPNMLNKRMTKMFDNSRLHNILWINDKWHNYSLLDFRLKIFNLWTEQLENYKIKLSFEWNIDSISSWNGIYTHLHKNVFIYDDKTWKLIDPTNAPLLPEDKYIFDDIYIKPKIEKWDIIIKWKLFSSKYNAEWNLNINIKMDIIENEEIINIEDNIDEYNEFVFESFYMTDELKNKLENKECKLITKEVILD